MFHIKTPFHGVKGMEIMKLISWNVNGLRACVQKNFMEDFEKLDIVTTFNLVYNAAIMVEAGIGYAVTIDKIANTSESSSLCFRPLTPRLDSGLNIVWKKYQVFSSAAEVFLERLRQEFEKANS